MFLNQRTKGVLLYGSILLLAAETVVCRLVIFPRIRAISLYFLDEMNSGFISLQNRSKDTVFPESTNYRYRGC